jgi:methylated-DNA-[protein]-cysteine S-methyltransferase
MNPISYTRIESRVGPLLLAGDATALTRLEFHEAGRHRLRIESHWREDAEPFRAAVQQLGEYFAGDRREFELALRLDGTEFQRRVWAELVRIPYGETISYGELARRIGNPAAARAVGLANGANPVAIVVPCHRVIGSDGSLTGFGGGLPIKQKLLDLERRQRTAREFPIPVAAARGA